FQIINDVFVSLGRESITIQESSYVTQSISPLRIMVMVAPIVLYFLITSKKKLNNKQNFYINMIIINAYIYLTSANSAYLARFALYTIPYIPIGFPVLFKGVNKKTSVIIIYIALILYFLYWGY